MSRIEASRRAGVHVILPDADPVSTEVGAMVSRNPVVRRWSWGGLAAAACVTLAVLAGQSLRQEAKAPIARTGSARISGDDSDTSFETANAVFSALSPLPSFAQAQSAPSDNVRLIDTGIDGTKLKPGSWRYVTTEMVNGVRSGAANTRTVVLERAIFQQRPVWRLMTTDARRGIASDTTLLESRDLRPIERRWHVGIYDVIQQYGREHPDQIFTVATRTTKDATARATTDTMRLGMNASGLMIHTDVQLQLLFKLASLHRGWHLTYGYAGGKIGKSSPVASSTRTLRVVGEEVIQTSRGSVPVWRISYDGKAWQSWYVSKANGELVRVIGQRPGSHAQFQTDVE